MTQTCPPEPGATRRPLEQAKALVALGHDVTLITAYPSYPLGRIHDEYRNGRRSRETVDGVRIRRVWSLVAPNQGTVRRLLAYWTFAASAVMTGLRLGPVDIVMGSVPKPFTGLAAWMIARLRRAVCAVELRDLLPDSLQIAQFKESGLGYALLDRYYRWLYRHVDVIAVAYRWMIPKLRERGADRARLLHLPHAVDPHAPGASRDRVRETLGLSDRFVATYAGSFSSHYRIPDIVDAARELIESHPAAAILLIGTGQDHERVRRMITRQRIHNVTLLGGIEPCAVSRYLDASDLFIQVQWLPEFTDGTKILEYLAAGKPIVNMCAHPAAFGQAETESVGRSVPFGDPPGMAGAIEFYATNPDEASRAGTNAQDLIRGRHERRTVVRTFSEALEKTVESLARER